MKPLNPRQHDIQVINHCPFRIEPMEGKDAMLTQDRGCDLLQAIDIPYWISSGNLLGLYRDGKLIPHDTDIDVNIRLEWNTDEAYNLTAELINQFQTHQFNLIRSNFYLNHAMQLAWMDLETQVIFDIYPFYTGIEPDVAINYNAEGIIKKPLKFIDELQPFVYNGVTYPIPNHIEDFLVWRFGADWKTPKHSKQPWQTEATHVTLWENV